MSAPHPPPSSRPGGRIALALALGGTLWIVAALVGGDDGTTRFYLSEAIWLVAQALLLVATAALVVSVRPWIGRPGRVAGAVAVVGRVAFVAAEVGALLTGELQEALLPPAALATAVGSLVLGVSIVRARCWDGLAGGLAVAVGAYPFVAMFPFAAAADGPPVLALAGWGVVTASLGVALVRADARAPSGAEAAAVAA